MRTNPTEWMARCSWRAGFLPKLLPHWSQVNFFSWRLVEKRFANDHRNSLQSTDEKSSKKAIIWLSYSSRIWYKPNEGQDGVSWDRICFWVAFGKSRNGMAFLPKRRKWIRLDHFEILLPAKQPTWKRPPYRMTSLVVLQRCFRLPRFIAMGTLETACILRRKGGLGLGANREEDSSYRTHKPRGPQSHGCSEFDL